VRADIVKLLRWQAVNWTSRIRASRVAKARRPGVNIPAAYAAARKRCGDCPMDRVRRQAKN
jgi:hypothetical protein